MADLERAALGPDRGRALRQPVVSRRHRAARRRDRGARPQPRRRDDRRRRPALARHPRAAVRVRRGHRRRQHPAARRAHVLRRRRRRLHRDPRRAALRARVPDAAAQHLRDDRPGRARVRDRALRADLVRQPRGGQRLDGQLGLPLGGRERRLHVADGARGLRGGGPADHRPQPLRGPAAGGDRRRANRVPRRASSRSSSSTSPAPARPSRRSIAACAHAASSAARICPASFPELGQSALYCVTEMHTAGRHRPARRCAWRGGRMKLRRYHAAVWDEPLVMEMGRPGGRGVVFDGEPEIARPWGTSTSLVSAGMRRASPPALPELSEPGGAAPQKKSRCFYI